MRLSFVIPFFIFLGVPAVIVAEAGRPEGFECTEARSTPSAELLSGVVEIIGESAGEKGERCLATFVRSADASEADGGGCVMLTHSDCVDGAGAGRVSVTLPELGLRASAEAHRHPLAGERTPWKIVALVLEASVCRRYGAAVGVLPLCGTERNELATEPSDWSYFGGHRVRIDDFPRAKASDRGAPLLRFQNGKPACVAGLLADPTDMRFTSASVGGWASAIWKKVSPKTRTFPGGNP